MKMNFLHRYIILSGTLLLIGAMTLHAQEESVRARLGISFKNVNNTSHILEASVKYKEEGSYVQAQDVPVYFYKMAENDSLVSLGTGVTNKKGVAVFELPFDEGKKEELLRASTYIAKIQDHPKFRDTDDEITVSPSKITITEMIEDSVHLIRCFIGTYDSSGALVPLEEVSGRLFAKRMFGDLPISDGFEYTDEEGYFTVEFPMDLPGDKNGNVDIIARVDEHEQLGTMIATKTVEWGVPTVRDDSVLKGKLWSTGRNAPMYLVVLTTSLLISVWGVLVFIILSLTKIRKLGSSLN